MAGGQHGTSFGPRQAIRSTDFGIRIGITIRQGRYSVVIELGQRRQFAEAGEGVGSLVDETARVRYKGRTRGLLVAEACLGHQPVEEREDLVEGRQAVTVGRESLIDGAIAPAQKIFLALGADAGLAISHVPEAVLVDVVEDTGIQAGEPVEHRHLAEVAAGCQAAVAVDAIRIDSKALAGDDHVQVGVEDLELIAARGHIRRY